MVLATSSPAILKFEKNQEIQIPVIDFSAERSEVCKQISKACEEYGFFKVINHGVSEDFIKKMEDESLKFFGKSALEKQAAGPAIPWGYGRKNIGFNGDTGEIEYLLLSVNPVSISQVSQVVSNATDPIHFSSAVNDYVEAVKKLACNILEMMAEGLGMTDSSVFSRLIRADDSDLLLRFNHYPPYDHHLNTNSIGFGEHTDPQILTILRSNCVSGLQISIEDGVWIPVTSDPSACFVNVGDLLQVMTNGRLMSVRHRAVNDPSKSRLSFGYFSGPPLHAKITVLPEFITLDKPSLYKHFTWADFKKTAYSLRLKENRLKFYELSSNDDQHEY
ncbi:Gibberellin 2-beta-dioxygenase 2 [Heracleum sosnowskyi]|uniref:gibberellin 2beta-dioxygenase n=1 Tax=Heracleum sosnowskyi TaxID=360622 RepID=A0AAD8I7W0_9APIA|nr:Gibberellin 2-beta-dioxygenase 2 [Heracleum sosnowskyi]